MTKYKLTDEEYDAVDGLHSYYCSLDIFDNNEEEIEASNEEQAIKRGLGKLLYLHRKKYKRKIGR